MSKIMTQEQKELLLKDLCGRLPYGVICKDTNINITGTLSQIGLHYDMCVLDKDNGESESCYIPNCKPYLYPLSSMTEEQSKIYHELIGGMFGTSALINFEVLEDFFHKNHLDYRGLIEKNLANDATNLNIY